MSAKEYNYALCEERHETIKTESTEMFDRLKKIENRFLVIVTLLIANLMGIIGMIAFK